MSSQECGFDGRSLNNYSYIYAVLALGYNLFYYRKCFLGVRVLVLAL